MKIHPKINGFIQLLKSTGYNDIQTNDEKALNILKLYGCTATEAMITLHQGFNLSEMEAQNLVNFFQIWEREDIQDIAYQTFLYMNYNPEDPDFFYTENSIKFSLTPPPEKLGDAENSGL